MESRFEDRDETLTLFDRLGGRVFTTLIAEKFCDRVAADAKLSEVIGTANLDELKKETTAAACACFSGDQGTLFPMLERAASQVALSQSHFSRCISHLIAALVWAGVNRELIEEVIDVVTPLSSQLVRVKR